MSIYEKYILPIIINATMSSSLFEQQRQKVLPLAKGTTLEIGIGTGANLKFYETKKVSKLWGLDISEKSFDYAKKEADKVGFGVELITGVAEDIPLPDESVDTVLSTFTLCTIQSVNDALSEINRVLKPDGKFIFCEHGQSPDKGVQRIQNILNSLNKALAGGCHLNRNIALLIEQNGFAFDALDKDYFSSPKFLTYTYWGVCSKQPLPKNQLMLNIIKYQK